MGVDLRSNTMFARISVVLLDDCLVKLEHGRTEDRVRRFMYDSIENVVIWKKIPWLRVILCTVFLVLPGIALQFPRDEIATYSGAFLLVLGLGLVGWYLVCKKTTIRITRSGTPNDLVGVFRPKRVRSLRDRLIANVQAAQLAEAVEPPVADSPTDVPPEPESQ